MRFEEANLVKLTALRIAQLRFTPPPPPPPKSSKLSFFTQRFPRGGLPLLKTTRHFQNYQVLWQFNSFPFRLRSQVLDVAMGEAC